jgi:hypothetical protein
MQALRVSTELPTEALSVEPRSEFKPVVAWAWVGGVVLAVQLYVWAKWILGPNFERVPAGPSDPPIWMQTVLIIWTGVIMAGFPVAIYHFIIKPWRTMECAASRWPHSWSRMASAT